MNKTKVTIQALRSGSIFDDQTIMLSDHYFQYWKIPHSRPLTLSFGSLRQQVKAVPMSTPKVLRMRPSLLNHFGLHHGTSLRLQYRPGSNTLRIGPIIGVLVNRVYSGNPEKLLGSITTFGREMSESGRQQGVFVYFFAPQEFHAQEGRIKGWHYYNGWNSAHFPVPHVVHNRLTTRRLENKTSVQHFMKDVKSLYNTSIFNEKYLNKNEVFQALNREAKVRVYLPESYSLRNMQMLKTMCGRHAVVFLKPVRGSLGKGIIRIVRQPNQTYACHFASVNGTRKQVYSGLKPLFEAISGRLRAQRYQIQQGLDLIEIGTRPIDFRALVQKNAKAQWVITSIVARMASQHHFVSNLARGGSLIQVKAALVKSNLAPQRRRPVYVKLKQAAVDIAHGIESQIPYHFGELGVDLAVDRSGKVWLLEVNSKPSKDNNSALQENKIRPSVKQIIQYAKYLSDF